MGRGGGGGCGGLFYPSHPHPHPLPQMGPMDRTPPNRISEGWGAHRRWCLLKGPQPQSHSGICVPIGLLLWTRLSLCSRDGGRSLQSPLSRLRPLKRGPDATPPPPPPFLTTLPLVTHDASAMGVARGFFRSKLGCFGLLKAGGGRPSVWVHKPPPRAHPHPPAFGSTPVLKGWAWHGHWRRRCCREKKKFCPGWPAATMLMGPPGAHVAGMKLPHLTSGMAVRVTEQSP